MENENKNNNLLIPASIVVAGLLIAFAVFYTNGAPANPRDNKNDTLDPNTMTAENVKPVDASDHILGNPNAEIFIVEYSDLECPFCKLYHPTLKRIIQEYGKDGKVAWVYRHFPIPSLHPNAPKIAEASECAAELGGNNAFWSYIDKILVPNSSFFDLEKLPVLAQEIGLDKTKFEQCLSSGKYAEKVEKDYENAVKSGGDGTPYTIVVTTKGEKIPFSGALPYSDPIKTGVKEIIEKALRSN